MKIYQGSCLEVLKTLPDNSVDSIVTDPPYGLAFMGKKWDYDVPSVDIWKEALRVLKPGGHLLSFGGTRTYHRMVVNIEDAGFEIRDQLQWLYGSGFPKSQDVSKQIDKQAGVTREVIGQNPNHRKNEKGETHSTGTMVGDPHSGDGAITAPTTPEAKQWEGWGTALKPANEPICLARKPLEKGLTVAQNVLKHSTGALNIDGSRIGVKHDETRSFEVSVRGQAEKQHDRYCVSCLYKRVPGLEQSIEEERLCNLQQGLPLVIENGAEKSTLEERTFTQGRVSSDTRKWNGNSRAPILDGNLLESQVNQQGSSSPQEREPIGQSNREPRNCTDCGSSYHEVSFQTRPKDRPNDFSQVNGRWPSNCLFSESAAKALDEQSGVLDSGGPSRNPEKYKDLYHGKADKQGLNTHGKFNKKELVGYADKGGASRFFYVAKASKRERNAGLDECDHNECDHVCTLKPTKTKQGNRPGSPDMTGKFPDHDHRPSGGNNHPTVKPIKLMEYLIKMITPPNGIVLDPFMGSGTTGVACKNLGFIFIGIEKEPEYCEIARRRINGRS